MPCYSPHRVHSDGVKENGALNIIWRGQNKGLKDEILPCSRCVGCKLERSRNQAVRCMLEADMHEHNCFVTLTFDDKHIAVNRSLDKNELQLFMKRLRKKYGDGIKFFGCGEYGEMLGRPHYHVLLFNHDFDDKVLHTVRNGHKLFVSESLQKLWQFGFSSVGEVSYESASYVARYVLKKIGTENSEEHYVDKGTGEILTPEFTLMSRGGRKGKGLAASWFQKFGFTDVYPSDQLVVNGKVNKPPRYFDTLLEKLKPQLFDEVKQGRREYTRDWYEQSDIRLRVKEEVKLRQIQALKRDLR